MNDVDSKQFGVKGCLNETGTTAVTGNFYAIQVLEDSNFSLLTDATASGDALTGRTIVPQILFGNFSAFTLTSGAVRAYVK
jgi:hypothetical protein